MPDHTSFLSYLVALLGLDGLAHSLGTLVISGHNLEAHHIESSFTAILVALFVIVLAVVAGSKVKNTSSSIVPEEKLTLRTFIELFVGFFYSLAKDVMGPKRAKKFFPVIGTSALFVFFSNVMGLIPGLAPPTSSLSVTLGSALLVFLAFNYYGVRENGVGYLKHLFGPWLGPIGIPVNLLIFCVEVLSLCVRPLTLAVRLMINMAVDHLIASIFIGLFALLVPIPTMLLGILVVCVQTMVFALLAAVYIGMATEHEEHH